MQTKLRDGKTEKLVRLIDRDEKPSFDNILVIGCGRGIEAAILSQQLCANVIGIDIKDDFDKVAMRHADLRVSNAMRLDFPDASFDLVYSFHVLEHIQEPRLLLKEARRVLKPGGRYFIGTPNKNRIIGYMGSKNSSLKQKISFNINDWKYRTSGRFDNKFGAHAGFTKKELAGLLNDIFSSASDVSDSYYKIIYRDADFLLKLIKILSIQKYLYPSIYFIGTK